MKVTFVAGSSFELLSSVNEKSSAILQCKVSFDSEYLDHHLNPKNLSLSSFYKVYIKTFKGKSQSRLSAYLNEPPDTLL